MAARVWECILGGSECLEFRARNLAKSRFLKKFFQWEQCRFRPLSNMFWTLENCHSIHPQSTSPPVARKNGCVSSVFCARGPRDGFVNRRVLGRAIFSLKGKGSWMTSVC